MPQDKKASLQDILNYEPEKYITDDDLAIIRGTFKNNPRLFNVIRKILLPTINDPALPLEEMMNDVFLQSIDWQSVPAEHIKPIMLGRMEAVKFIAGGLIKLKYLAHTEETSAQELEARRKKDSVK